MKPLRFASEAVQELFDATDWYESRQAGLGRRFREEFEATLARVRERPAVFTILIQEPPALVVRRALLVKFPYALIFLDGLHELRVVAVAHTKRRPGYWLSRLEP